MARAYQLKVRATGDATDAERALRSLSGAATHAHERMRAAFIGIAKYAAAGIGIGLALAVRAGTEKLLEMDRVNAQTAAGLKSTGGAAGVTRKHILDLADATMRKTGIDATAVQTSENMLLTFTKIKNGAAGAAQNFDAASTAVANMATKMAGGAIPTAEQLQVSAIRLGKALNDPVKGATALRRVGVMLDEQQKKLIETFVKHGQMAKAQGVILKEMAVEFGGAAMAAGKTLTGQINILKDSFKVFMADGLSKVIPAVVAFAQSVDHAFSTGGKLRGLLMGLEVALGYLWQAVKKSAVAFVDAFAKGAGKGHMSLQQFATTVGVFIAKVALLTTEILPPLAAVLGTVAGFFARHTTLLKLVVVGFLALVSPVAAVGVVLTALVVKAGGVGAALHKVGSVITTVFDGIKSVVLTVVQYIAGKMLGLARVLLQPFVTMTGALSHLPGAAGKAFGDMHDAIVSSLDGVQRKIDTLNLDKAIHDASNLAQKFGDAAAAWAALGSSIASGATQGPKLNPPKAPGKGGRHPRLLARITSSGQAGIGVLGAVGVGADLYSSDEYAANMQHASAGFLQNRIGANTRRINTANEQYPKVNGLIRAKEREIKEWTKRVSKDQAALDAARMKAKRAKTKAQRAVAGARVSAASSKLKAAVASLKTKNAELTNLTGLRDEYVDALTNGAAQLLSDTEELKTVGPDQLAGTGDDVQPVTSLTPLQAADALIAQQNAAQAYGLAVGTVTAAQVASTRQTQIDALKALLPALSGDELVSAENELAGLITTQNQDAQAVTDALKAQEDQQLADAQARYKLDEAALSAFGSSGDIGYGGANAFAAAGAGPTTQITINTLSGADPRVAATLAATVNTGNNAGYNAQRTYSGYIGIGA